MKIWIDRAFAAVFAVVLAAPLVQMLTQVIRERPLEERRQAHLVPDFVTRLATLDSRLPGDANAWFNDRMGFRSTLTRLHNEIQYQVFRTSDRVVIGRREWLFLKDYVNAVVSDAKNDALDKIILSSLRGFRDCLAARGIKLVFVLTPTKSSIYPQFLPAKPPVDPPPRLAERLAIVLNDEPGLVFVEGEKILSKHSDQILFYKTDVHMNLKSSSYIYREMLARIAHTLGSPAPTPPPEIWNLVPEHGGIEERFLGKFFPIPDKAFQTPSVYTEFKSDALDTYEFNVGTAELPKYPDLPLYDIIYRNRRPAKTLLPPMMLFGTSFSDGFFELKYNEAFETIYRTRSNVPERIGPLMRHLPPDVRIFVLEFPEPLLDLILGLDTTPACATGARKPSGLLGSAEGHPARAGTFPTPR